MLKRNMRLAVFSSIALLTSTASFAGMTQLTSPSGDCGWSAAWDNSLDGLVQVIAQDKVGGICVIEKVAEFTQGPSPITGLFPPIIITFTQTSNSATPFIAINDEILKNSTGVHWTDFHMILVDSGDAIFRPDLTAASGGPGPIGWTIGPQFTNAAFSAGNTRLDIWNGPGVAPGGIWRPGDGVTNGELYMQLTLHDITTQLPTTFSLKETPTPEPMSMTLLALGGFLATRRRQRA